MGVSNKGKRKITINNKIYWWFVDEDSWREPQVHIIADDHSFIANCNLYCPRLEIIKDNQKGRRQISVPCSVSDKYFSFTPQYIADLIRIGTLAVE